MSARNRSTLLALGALVAASVPACAPLQPSATVPGGGGPAPTEARGVPYTGPKARVTVARFTDKTAKGYGEIGSGMSEMIASALTGTNRFIVLEPDATGEVPREQDSRAFGRVKMVTGAPLGQVEGAELLVVGAVTDFEPGAGTAGRAARIAIDLRIADARTSRVLAATRVRRREKEPGGPPGVAGGPLARGLSAFARTPMEQAIRACLRSAVNYIAGQTPAHYYHY